jgi:translation initiation factor 2 subunit 2
MRGAVAFMSGDDTAILFNYDMLLKRAYLRLPKRESRAYDIPQPEVEYIGDHTLVKNLGHIADRLKRDPKIIMRYMLKGLGAPGGLREDNSLIIYKKISAKSINDIYARFLEEYVRCPTCKSYDTELIREGKKWYIRCLACGAITYVPAV